MRAFIGAVNLLILLAVILAVVLMTGEDPGQLTVVWHGWDMQTTAAIAAVAVMMLLALAFYLGQFVSWLARLPATIRGWFRPAPPKHEMPRLLEAMAHHAVGDDKTAAKLLAKANPRSEEELLEAFARLQLGETDPVELERWVADPHIGPYAALVKAQHAATSQNWELVRTTTETALKQFGKLPALQILHLKALMNSDNQTAAINFLPLLRSHVPAKLWPLLNMAVRGPTSTNAAELDNPWFKTLSHWLSTPRATLPQVPQLPHDKQNAQKA
ncbi:MAG: heme biosynthesis protein HemY [Pseudomonadaceae bacterium]|nr:heme biosynthesis protein HemY [Pseudomonadaceae bacterium]